LNLRRLLILATLALLVALSATSSVSAVEICDVTLGPPPAVKCPI
jgi:hypothetical protein